MKNDNIIKKFISYVSKLPSLGNKSATKIAVHLMSNPDAFGEFIKLSSELSKNVVRCEICHNLDIINPCNICLDRNDKSNIICIVDEVSTLWAIEKSRVFSGNYHVLGGVLSALNNVTPDKLTVPQLLKRILNDKINEIVIAISMNLDGQTTSHYIISKMREIRPTLKISKLALGIPVGADIEYMDDSTIKMAMEMRREIE